MILQADALGRRNVDSKNRCSGSLDSEVLMGRLDSHLLFDRLYPNCCRVCRLMSRCFNDDGFTGKVMGLQWQLVFAGQNCYDVVAHSDAWLLDCVPGTMFIISIGTIIVLDSTYSKIPSVDMQQPFPECGKNTLVLLVMLEHDLYTIGTTNTASVHVSYIS